MDTGSKVTFIPKKFWERIGKPTLWKIILQLRQIDESIEKALGYFEGYFKLEDKFEVVPIIVTISKKNHGLLGNEK